METSRRKCNPVPLVPLLLAAVLLFAAVFWLDTRGNGFPFFYHPDEPDKVDQLITHKWNFHHPLLMLGTAEVVKTMLHAPAREQALVELGRACSAAFAAAGSVFLALLAWRVRGWMAFWIAGLLLLTQHQIFELSHYFKEDTALLCTMGLAFLALHWHWKRGGMWSALAAGAACGLCVSAKYLGAVVLAPAIVLMLIAQRQRRARGAQWGLFALGFVAAVGLVNFPIFAKAAVFVHSFGRETTLVAHGERGYTGGQFPILEYLRMFTVDINPVVWLLLIAGIVQIYRRPGKYDAFDRTLAIFPFAFMLLLSCSSKTNDRYFLPATGLFYYVATIAAADLIAGEGALSRLGEVGAGLAVCANILFLIPYLRAFAHDDRADMLAWIRANIPANAVIAAEDRADLPVPDRKERLAVQPLLPQRIVPTKYAADLGATPAALAAQGIGYVVLCESDYGIFIRKAASTHLSPALTAKRDFYEALFQTQPLWERPRGSAGIYLHPGLRIYRVGS